MNNALWSPRGARAGERNLATGSTIGDGWEEVLVRNVFTCVTLRTSNSSSLNIMSLPGIEHAPPLIKWAMKDMYDRF